LSAIEELLVTHQELSEETQINDLEQEISDLQNVKLGNGDDSETLKLKRLFLTFKTKYQQALKELATREQSQCSSQIQKKFDELQEENQALVQQQQALREMLKSQQASPQSAAPSPETNKLEELNNKLQHALHEKDREIADLKHYELGFKRLSDENRKLESILNTGGNGERKAMLEEIEDLKNKLGRLTEENRQMTEQCEQQKHQAENLTTKEEQLQRELNEQKAANQTLRVDLIK